MKHDGYVLIIVISLVAILMVVALSFSGYAHFSLMRGNQTKESLQTIYLAKSAVAAALVELKTKSAAGKTEGELVPQMNPITSDVKLVYTAQWKPAGTDWVNTLTKNGLPASNYYLIEAKGLIQVKDKPRAVRAVIALVDLTKSGNLIVYWEDLGNQ